MILAHINNAAHVHPSEMIGLVVVVALVWLLNKAAGRWGAK